MASRAPRLSEGEEVVVDVRPHWRYLAAPVMTVAVLIAAAITVTVVGGPSALDWVVAAILIVGAGWLLARYARWATTDLMVTSSRLIQRQGILAKSGREVPLDHLNDISYRQSLFDRLLGAGDLVLESTGREGQEVFADLPHPDRIQQEIYGQIDAGRTRAANHRGGRELSIPEQVEKLDELRRRGVITDAEFDAQKAQLLNRL